MRICLVHDDFCQLGGAERLFEEFAKIFPNAPIYTSLINWDKVPESIDKKRIHASFMHKIPFATKFYKLFLPFYPMAFESLDFSDFDIVLSSTTRFAKSVITKPQTVSICYINSIPRFLYHKESKEHYLPPVLNLFLKPFFIWLQRWDKASAQRVDLYIANSQNVADTIKQTYGRESKVIHPFADTSFFHPAKIKKTGNYFLVVSRLVKWKKIDIAIEACRSLNQRLVIIGTGPDEKRLRTLAQKNTKHQFGETKLEMNSKIEFISKVSKEQLKSFYQNAIALLVTQQEDFGISMVESQACGTPVIAFEKGGAAEIIISQKTGILYNQQTAQSLKGAIIAHSRLKWDVSELTQNAQKFSKENFVKLIKSIVTENARIKR